MTARKPKASQYNLDFESQQRERWAAIRSLALPPSSVNCRIRFVIETIESLGGGRLAWRIADLGRRLSCPESTLRQSIAEAERLGLIKVGHNSRSSSGKFDVVPLENDIAAMRSFNASQYKSAERTHKPKAGSKSDPSPTTTHQEAHQPSLAELVQATGIGNWRDAVADIEQRNISAPYVQSLIKHWQENRGIWEKPEGVLYFRLINAIESRPVDQGWPDQSRVAPAAAKTSERLKEFDEYKSGVNQERVQMAAKEAEWGQQLDALDGEQLKDLAASCMDIENDIYGRMFRKYVADPGPGVVREKLLITLSRRNVGCSTG